MFFTLLTMILGALYMSYLMLPPRMPKLPPPPATLRTPMGPYRTPEPREEEMTEGLRK